MNDELNILCPECMSEFLKYISDKNMKDLICPKCSTKFIKIGTNSVEYK